MADIMSDLTRANTRLTRIESSLDHVIADLKTIKRGLIGTTGATGGAAGVIAMLLL